MPIELLTESMEEQKLNVEIPIIQPPIKSDTQYESSSSVTSFVSSSPTNTTTTSSTSLDTSVTSDSSDTISSPVSGPTPRKSKSTGILNTGTCRSRAVSLLGGLEPSESSSSLNVRFAPLPELAPRRRKSTVPLGVAARSQLMRRRQMTYASLHADEYETNPMWTEEETAEHMKRQLKAQAQETERPTKRREDGNGNGQGAGEEEEDPFVVLGRVFKGAWKRMAHKEKDKDKAKEKEKGGHEKEKEKSMEKSSLESAEKGSLGEEKPNPKSSSESEDVDADIVLVQAVSDLRADSSHEESETKVEANKEFLGDVAVSKTETTVESPVAADDITPAPGAD